MATYLSQILAVKSGIKSQAYAELTAAHHNLQKSGPQSPLAGISRVYEKINDDDVDLPDESTKVQYTAGDVINEVKLSLTRMFDVTATSEWADTVAKSDIKVNGTTLVADVPATYLLFLEKQLNDLHTFVQKLPILDPSEDWEDEVDPVTRAYKSKPKRTTKTRKIRRNHVKWEPPSPEYDQPAQIETYDEDIVVGYWSTTKFSGALPAATIHDMLERVRTLQAAVKHAREVANRTEVENKHVGSAILDFIFG